MREDQSQKIAIILDDISWNKRFLEDLTTLGIPYETVIIKDAAYHLLNHNAYALYVNRTSPSSYIRGHGTAIPYAKSFMRSIEASGGRILNGLSSFQMETSKINQYILLTQMNLHVPQTLAFNNRAQILSILDRTDLPFPSILKPDLGGSGAYVQKIKNKAQLKRLLKNQKDLFGRYSPILLLQEFLSSHDSSVIRMEYVGSRFLFAYKVRAKNTFNLCPHTRPTKKSLREEKKNQRKVEFEYYPNVPKKMIEMGRKILKRVQLDFGGIEYIETGKNAQYFIDINSTSVYREEICQAAGVDANSLLARFVARKFKSAIRS